MTVSNSFITLNLTQISRKLRQKNLLLLKTRSRSSLPLPSISYRLLNARLIYSNSVAEKIKRKRFSLLIASLFSVVFLRAGLRWEKFNLFPPVCRVKSTSTRENKQAKRVPLIQSHKCCASARTSAGFCFDKIIESFLSRRTEHNIFAVLVERKVNRNLLQVL